MSDQPKPTSEWTAHEVEPDEWGIWAEKEPIRRHGMSESTAKTICFEHNAALAAEREKYKRSQVEVKDL